MWSLGLESMLLTASECCRFVPLCRICRGVCKWISSCIGEVSWCLQCSWGGFPGSISGLERERKVLSSLGAVLTSHFLVMYGGKKEDKGGLDAWGEGVEPKWAEVEL